MNEENPYHSITMNVFIVFHCTKVELENGLILHIFVHFDKLSYNSV